MTKGKGQPFSVVEEAIDGLFGEACCRQRVGGWRSLSIGFGEKRFHGNPKLSDDYYGAWEVGTYRAAWRIVRAGRVLCGSQDVVDSTQALDARVAAISLAPAVMIEMPSDLDIRLILDDGTHIDFLGSFSESDEHVFHVFGPDHAYVQYSIATGWEVGRSNEASR